jgi:hypothetical protein
MASQIEVEKPSDIFVTTSRPIVDSVTGPNFDIVTDVDDQTFGGYGEKTTENPYKAAFKFDAPERTEQLDDERYKTDKEESFDAFLNPRKTVKKEEEAPPEPAIPSMQRVKQSPPHSRSPSRVPTVKSRSPSRGRAGYGNGISNYFHEETREHQYGRGAKQMIGAFTAAVPSDEVADPLETPEELLSPIQLSREKARLLNEYREVNTNFVYNQTELSMESSLHDIRTNLFLVKDQKSRVQGRKLVRKMMTVGATAAVGISNQYEVFGVDMTDWLKLFNHEVNTEGDYDDIIDELVTKYKQKMSMPVEVKLAVAVATSFGTAVINKREEVKLLKQMKEKMEEERQERERHARETMQAAAEAAHLMRQQQAQFNQMYNQQHQQVHQPPPLTVHVPQPRVSTVISSDDVKEMLKENDQFMDESEYQVSESGHPDPASVPLPDENTLGAGDTVDEKPQKRRVGRPKKKN